MLGGDVAGWRICFQSFGEENFDMNALGKLLLLAALGLTTLPAAAPAQPAMRGPYVLIVRTDAGKDSVPRGSPLFDSIQDAMVGDLRARGFRVFDEAVIPRDVLPAAQSGNAAELIEMARLVKVPIDVLVVTQISVSVRPMQHVRDAFKPGISVVGRMTKVRSGEPLGRFETGGDIDFPLIREDCAASQECLLKSIANEAQQIGSAAGTALATRLAAETQHGN
jgi:hypothetical protein